MLSGFFTNKDVVAEDFATFAAGILSNGVLADKTDTLKITASGGMTVSAATGYCWINGFFGKAEIAESLTLSTASGIYPRYDRIVARLDLLQKAIYLAVIEGVPALNPTAPSIIRDGTYYDLGLALILIPAGSLSVTNANIIDTRMDEAVCGGVTARTSDKLTLEGKLDKSEITQYVSIGDIKATARATAPSKWMICDGRAISRTTYSELFLAIGTTYGKGNGSTTFNIPNLKGRVIAGYDSSNEKFDAIGKLGGKETHKLTVEEMPSHAHTIPKIGNTNSFTAGQCFEFNDSALRSYNENYIDKYEISGYINATGENVAHNILQPYMALNYLIFTGVE